MIRTTLRALRHRNFALFLGGQMCSLVGYWMQTVVVDDKRGRVMSLYTAAFLGMAPFGALAAGAAADVIGIAPTLAICGACCATGALYLAANRRRIREHIRPIYARLGISDAVKGKW